MDPDGSAGDVPRLSWDRSRAMGGRRAGVAQGGGTFLHQPEFSCSRSPTRRPISPPQGAPAFWTVAPGIEKHSWDKRKVSWAPFCQRRGVGHLQEVATQTLRRSERWPGLHHLSALGQNTQQLRELPHWPRRAHGEGQLCPDPAKAAPPKALSGSLTLPELNL